MSNDPIANDSLITLATFSTPTEAALARNRLEAAEIRCFLADATTVGMAWHLGGALGGIKLQVMQSQAEQALAILEAGSQSTAAGIAPEDWLAGSDANIEDVADDDSDEAGSMAGNPDLERAYRSSVIGLIFLPLQIYSVLLLLKVTIWGAQLSPTDHRKYLLAFALNIPILYLLFLLAWYIPEILTFIFLPDPRHLRQFYH